MLAVTKQTAQDVAEKLANASETNKKINEACEEYRPVAHRATLIYFLIAEFSVVNCMYQTSLAQFNQLYELSIDRSDRANMPSKRIHNIIEYMTYEIYLYIQRGLFERHKIIFALMLTNKILISAGKIKVSRRTGGLRGLGLAGACWMHAMCTAGLALTLACHPQATNQLTSQPHLTPCHDHRPRTWTCSSRAAVHWTSTACARSPRTGSPTPCGCPSLRCRAWTRSGTSPTRCSGRVGDWVGIGARSGGWCGSDP